MVHSGLIRTVEEHALNAWPALQQLLYDGWIVRFANGYTKRANSVNPLYDSTLPIQPKIERCMALYQAQELPTVFRLTPLAPPEIDEALARLDFYAQSPTSVQLLDISDVETPLPATFHAWPLFSFEWEAHFARLHGRPIQQATHQAILRSIIPAPCFAILREQEQVVACGLGVQEGDFVGLFDLIVDPAGRRQGFGQALIAGILHWARQRGATQAYLQVEKGNTPALNLYQKLGFSEVYHYWYRVSAHA